MSPGTIDEKVKQPNALWVVALPAVAVLATMAIAILAVVVTVGSDDNAGTATAGEPMTVDVELGEFYVKPATITVPPGTELTLRVTNAGAMPHDLKLADGSTGTTILDAGASEEVVFGVMEASTEAWCTIPGHKEAGMVLAIEVTGAAPGGGGGGTPGGEATGASIDFAAEPGPDFLAFDPALKPAPGGTEHKVTLRATEKVIEVAPGVTQELWTFNDEVPGPTLRGRVGDIFTVTLINEGTLGHSIDFHASKVAWNDEMRTIEPGESLIYQFEAKHAGIFMYHCGTAPALHHIGNGMFGALIVDPPNLPPVDHEFVFVQSELYLGPDGDPGDLAKMQDEAFDAVVFNGYVDQYKHVPIRVEPGERVRAWVLDAGPNENSAFHIVGTIFDTVFKEGTFVLRPDARTGGSQVLDLQPAQGGFVEFTFDEAGLYPIVTHKFSNVGKGALGLFQAGEVASTDAGH